MTCSRPGPSRNRAGPEQEDQDRVRNDAGLDAAGTGPVRAEPGVDVREDESMEVDRARTPGPACAMRAQRNAIHPTSRRASPARRNPPALDPRDPAWRNASPGDITKTTPRGQRPTPPQGRGAQEDRGRLGDSGPEAPWQAGAGPGDGENCSPSATASGHPGAGPGDGENCAVGAVRSGQGRSRSRQGREASAALTACRASARPIPARGKGLTRHRRIV